MDMREMDCCLGVSSILSDPKSPSAYLLDEVIFNTVLGLTMRRQQPLKTQYTRLIIRYICKVLAVRMVKEDSAHLAYILIDLTRVTDLGTNLSYHRLRWAVDDWCMGLSDQSSGSRPRGIHPVNCSGGRQATDDNDKLYHVFHWLASFALNWLAHMPLFTPTLFPGSMRDE